jgi:hypothetical protein
MVAGRFLLLVPACLFLRGAAASEDLLFPEGVSFPVDLDVAASGENSIAVQTPGTGEEPLAPDPERPPAAGTPPPQEPERWSSFLPLGPPGTSSRSSTARSRS